MIGAVSTVPWCEAKPKEFCEEDVEGLHISHYSIVDAAVDEVSDSDHFYSARRTALVRKLKVRIFRSNRRANDDLALDLDELLDQVKFAVGV